MRKESVQQGKSKNINHGIFESDILSSGRDFESGTVQTRGTFVPPVLIIFTTITGPFYPGITAMNMAVAWKVVLP
jgi:hypothetical protein